MGKELFRWDLGLSGVGVSVSPDWQFLVAGNDIYDLVTGKAVKHLKGTFAAVLSDKAEWLANISTAGDGGVQLIQLSSDNVQTLRPFFGRMTVAEFAPGDRFLAVGESNGAVQIIKLDSEAPEAGN